ncbi:MAG: PQQ-binding-like beta-propeller repeat protein [Rhodopirellula sp.]|nr:PQQ-binding-like beta-propeller repeat protein [Rhodopirellula sp.]
MSDSRNAYWTAALLAVLILGSLSLHPARADWPTCRGDNQRSGTTTERIDLPLVEQWAHRATLPPQPAWPEAPARIDVYRNVPLGPTVVFDRAFHVVAQNDRVYYGSSADDSVYCLDATTGDVEWCFTTEGPVRLAPTVAGDKVYAGSDDGCVYCLEAGGGHLLWKRRIAPEDRRLPGNGRIMSLWPVRCGLVVDAGQVYVCAGLFPSQGAYLCALDAETGEEAWKEQVDISAQGYLLASSERLFVPTGRTPPHIYNRADGRQVAPFPGIGQQRSGTPEGGGCFAVLVGDQLLHAAGEKGGIQITDAQSRETIVTAFGSRVIVQGPTSYILASDRLCALDRSHYIELTRLQQKKKKTPAEEQRIAELGGDSRKWLKWEIACPTPFELILAGDVLLAGGENRVVAYDLAEGRQLWTGPVVGKAYSLAVSGGRLMVGTDQGTIHCFKPMAASPANVAVADSEKKPASPHSGARDLHSHRVAETALAAAGTAKGYCLVLGAGSGELVCEIARQSQFRVIGVESDAAKVAVARTLLRGAGLYGSRAVIHHASLDRLPYQKWFANLIVCDETTGVQPATPAAEVQRLLRPSGGVAVVVQSPDRADAHGLQRWAAASLPGAKIQRLPTGEQVLLARRGPLPGAGEWTHFHADSGNTACSRDALEPGPVNVQWFGRPGPRKMVDRHEKNVAPLYADGRMFISGDNYIVAVDAYNGTILWEHDLPQSIRLGAFKNSGSMAVDGECLYVAAAGTCAAFDVATGQRRQTFSLPVAPGGPDSEWGYVAVVGDTLFGSVTKPEATFRIQDVPTQTLIWRDFQPVVTSDALFAFDSRTGGIRWTYLPEAGAIANPTIAVGAGRVYCVESTNPASRDVADGRVALDVLVGKGSSLVALDAATGKVLWKRPAELEALQHVVFLSYADETLVITGTKNVTEDDKPLVRYDLSAFDAATGERLWQSTQRPVPDHIVQGPHGEQVQHSAIVGDVIYNTGFALKLRTGEPFEGWKWQKSDKCGVLSTSARCGFSRFSNPMMFDFQSGEAMALTSVTRPGCWINILPAGGLILIPEASSGCTCYYSIQTSVALAPRQ